MSDDRIARSAQSRPFTFQALKECGGISHLRPRNLHAVDLLSERAVSADISDAQAAFGGACRYNRYGTRDRNVMCTFDLEDADSDDYAAAYADLESIGLRKVVVGGSGAKRRAHHDDGRNVQRGEQSTGVY